MEAAATTNAGATTQDARQAAGGVETAVGRVRRMTVATVGVLFRADASKPLNARDSASLIPAAERAIRAAAAQGLELFLITHVDSDAAQESAQKSLKSSGISGTAIPPHRCLFCDTDVGRTALVRQLEPDVHVDAGLASVTELARFLPRVAHVVSTGSTSSTVGKNVTSCAGLAELLLTS
uniref:Uncharacterized protein n=1 Tax=Pycnococcus provasolii TaxID=41880 RepID=A0A7S2FF64_9CHLO|mmetsp:Transcript_6737/g.15329  ORF Transcript_6737/g.15329 Transcript_6737/m.15329 type:complete len:180 (+) Transcript_6737:2-541(+)